MSHDIQAILHVPVQHQQLQGARQPMQEKRKMLRMNGFITSAS
jgi:hypothetical protein